MCLGCAKPRRGYDEAVKSLVDNKGVGANYHPSKAWSKEEWGGPKGEAPTRYGDWEVKRQDFGLLGRISDF